MLKIRVIPILTYNGFALVKTKEFKNPRMLGNPVQAARVYNSRGVDELVFVDIFASKQGRKINLKIAKEVIKECFMPVSIGGGIDSLEGIKNLLQIGADKVIDYTKEDFSQQNVVYDVIYDAVGKIPKQKRKVSLNMDGTFINVLALGGGLKVRVSDIKELKELIEAGHLKTVIDREYSLDQMVEAHHYVDNGHKKGNVIINVGGLEAKKVEIEEKDQRELTYEDGVIIEEADIDKTIVSIGNG